MSVKTKILDYETKFNAKDESGQYRLLLLVILLCTIFFVIVSVIGDTFFSDVGVSDVIHYYDNISNIIDKHLWPYSSEFPFEYPPLTLLVFLVPKIFSWDSMSFHIFYNIFAALCFALMCYFMFKIASEFKKNRYSMFLFFLMTILVLNLVLFDRNDIFAVTLVVGAIYAYLKEKYWLAAILLGFGAMIKVYPILLVPVFMIMFISKRDWKNTVIFPIIAAAVCLIIELPFIIHDPNTAFSWVTFHSERGLQAEAVVSSIVLLINFFWPCIDKISTEEYFSNTLYGEFPDAIASAMTPILLAALIAVFVMVLFRMLKTKCPDKNSELRILAIMSFIAITTFITFNKVYSSQYVMWFFTLIPLFILRKDSVFFKKVMIFAILALFSGLVAFTIGTIAGFNAIPILIVFFKNVAHVVLFISVIKIFLNTTNFKLDKSSA